MVVLSGKSAVGNVIHLIVGPETEFWLDLHGAAITGISEVLKSMDASIPIYLSLTRCRNEAAMIDEIQAALAAGETYPFPLPTPAPDRPTTTVPISAPVSVSPAIPAKIDPAGLLGHRQPSNKVRCSRCGGDRDLVPKLLPAICYSCVKIDLALLKNTKPAGLEEVGEP
jgi:hypothetical protein